MPLTLKLAILVMAPLVLLNVTRAVVLDMPYNVAVGGAVSDVVDHRIANRRKSG